MSDYAFMTVSVGDGTIKPEAYYRENLDSVIVRMGQGSMHLPPDVAAELVDQITAALDVYASTLRAVA